MDEFLIKTRKAMLESNSLFEDYAYKYIVEDIMFKTGKIYNGLSNAPKQVAEERMPLVPGNVYTFKYVAAADKSKPMDQAPKNYDTLPVVLCTEVHKDKIRGINFNLCSRTLKTGILNELQNVDPDYYYGDAKSSGVLKGSPNVIKMFLSSDMTSKFIQLVSSKYKVSSQDLLVRSYKIDGIKYLKLIDLSLWKYIPFLRYKSTLREDVLKTVMSKMQRP